MDADLVKLVEHCLRDIRVSAIAGEFPRVKALRITGVGQEASGLYRVMEGSWRPPVELEVIGNNTARHVRIAEGQSVIDRHAVDGEVCSETHPLIMPRRVCIPLIGEFDPLTP